MERSFAWLNFFRRLAKDYEKTVESSFAFIQIAFIDIFIDKSLFKVFYVFFEIDFCLLLWSSTFQQFFVGYPLLYALYGKSFLTVGFNSLHSLEYMDVYLAESKSSHPLYFIVGYCYNFFTTKLS